MIAGAETLEIINSAANMVGVASMIMEPISKEIVTDLVGTNHKSTSIANNYISVNGKLFHRQPSGSWLAVANNEFTLNATTKLVGGTNAVVNNFIPYTIKTNTGIENHCIRLRNGKVYSSKKIPVEGNRIIHQDSISNTIGQIAYVSYGPVNPENGFVAKNAYLDTFQPAIGESAEVRSRKNHPAYKEATIVTLHKIIADSFEKDLYDYPVSRVSIQQGEQKLSHHYYQYDGSSASYHVASKIAFYGKVIDIPSSKDYDINTNIQLNNTDGGYIEYYYYNLYNAYGKEEAVGYPSTPVVLKIPEPNLVTFQSSYVDDSESFVRGNVSVLNGHPYTSIVYNTSQEMVSQDYTYYKIWESDLKHQLSGLELQESRAYTVRPVKKINIIDKVVHKSTYSYEFAPINLMLREETVESTTIKGEKEVHKTRYTYANEQYTSLRMQNRLAEHFMTVKSIKKGEEEELITSADVTAYDTFMINGKEILAPKNFYKAKEAMGTAYHNNLSGVLGDIVSDISKQTQKEIEYEQKVIETYKGYIDIHKAASFVLKEEIELSNEVHQLNSEVHSLIQDIDEYKKLMLEDNANVQVIQRKIVELQKYIKALNTSINNQYNLILIEQEKIEDYSDIINIGWLGGLIGYGIAYGINHPKIEASKKKINKLHSEITKHRESINNKEEAIHVKRIELTSLVDNENEAKEYLQKFEDALKKERELYFVLKKETEHSLIKSQEALKDYHKIALDTIKHDKLVVKLRKIKTDNLHDNYNTALDSLLTSIESNTTSFSHTQDGNTVVITGFGATFYENLKAKVAALKNKISVHKAKTSSLADKHQNIIVHINELPAKGEQAFVDLYTHKWIKIKSIEARDTTTGIPIVIADEEGTTDSIELDIHHKKPLIVYKDIDIKSVNKRALYFGFEPEQNQNMFGGELSTDSHNGKHSIKLKDKSAVISEIAVDTKTKYLLSAWIKKEKPSDAVTSITITKGGSDLYKEFMASNDWTYVEAQIYPGVQPIFQGIGDLLIDDLLIRPISSNTMVSTYDDNGMVASYMTNNGRTIKNIYDDSQHHITTIDDEGKVIGYIKRFYSRNNNEEKYNSAKPNSILSIQFQGKGMYYGDQVPENASGVTFVEDVIPKNLLTKEYGISFIASSNFICTNSEYAIERKESNLIITNSQSEETDTIFIGNKKNFLILDLGKYVHVYVDGGLIKQIENTTDTENDIAIRGTVSNLLFAQTPVLTISYLDGTYRPIQHQQFYVNIDNQITGKIVEETLYNDWGSATIKTKPVLVNDKKLSYISSFAEYDPVKKTLTGIISDYYDNNKETNSTYLLESTADATKMFYKTEYSSDALQRVQTTHKAGVKDQLENNIRVSYQDALGKSLAQRIGISEENSSKFITITTERRDYDMAEVRDVFGRVLGSRYGKSISGHTYNVTNTGYQVLHRLPLSFQLENSDQYMNSFETLDLLGEQTQITTVDEGTNYVIKNKKGLPVFITTVSFSPQDRDLSWSYLKYDILNRPIESGIIKILGVFSKEKMNLLANVPMWMGNIEATPLKTWTYDILDKQTINNKGRLIQSMNKSNGRVVVTKYTYNKEGQVITKTTEINHSNSKTISYTYYSDGKLKEITYPNNTKVYYSYNKNGKLYGIGAESNPFEYAKYRYGINGMIIQKKYNDSGIINTTKYTLQEHPKEKTIVIDKNDGTAVLELFKETFGYEGEDGSYYDGMIVSKEEKNYETPETIWKYKYDSSNQLQTVEKEQPSTLQILTYTYDVNENIKKYENSTNTSKNIDYKYHSGSNKIAIINTEIASNQIGLYTKIGNSLLGNDTRLRYDNFTRKVSKIYAEGTLKKLEFTYDSNNNRVEKLIKSTVEQTDTLAYVWGNRSLPLYETFIGGKKDTPSFKTWNKTYIYGLENAPIAMLHKGETYYFVRDYQSSLRYVINGKNAEIAEKYSYEPYGKIAYAAQSNLEQPLGTYLYTGHEYDKEVGLYNFKARLYDPEKRIFLQPDPYHINYSPYTFVNNNPVNFVDRDGKAPLCILDDIEDAKLYSKLKDSFILVTFDELFSGRNLPNLEAKEFDGLVNIFIHHEIDGSSSKMYNERGGKRRFISRNKLSSSLGKYLKGSKVEEIKLNLATCFGAEWIRGESLLDKFSQSLANHSTKTVNGVGFTEAVSYTKMSGSPSPTFVSGLDRDVQYDHIRDWKNRNNLDVTNNALDRWLGETKAIHYSTESINSGLGPYGISKRFSPKPKSRGISIPRFLRFK